MEMQTLKEILPEKLKEGLTPAEDRLLEIVQDGTVADFRIGDEEKDNPEKAEAWGIERTIRSDFFYWLCTNAQAQPYIHAKGIKIAGAKIAGDVDFESAALNQRLGLFRCAISNINLVDANTQSLSLLGSVIAAFSANGLKVKEDLVLKEVKVKGEVRLLGADIGGDLDCTGATFENEKGDAFCIGDTTIGDALSLKNLKQLNGAVYLMYAQVGQIVDDESSWPEAGKLYLDGFEYKAFAGKETPLTAKKRLQWLRLQAKKPFYPQPYEQLAKVFRRIGHESDAREVLFAKQEDLRKYGVLSRKAKAWNWFLGFTIGHGYKPWKALLLIALFWIGGFFMFDKADNIGIMQPSKERVYMMSKDDKGNIKLPSEYPRFAPCVYSVDVFVPFVDLHQENYWLPDANKPHGRWFRIYFWAHIVAGWILSTLAAASLTGLIRKE